MSQAFFFDDPVFLGQVVSPSDELPWLACSSYLSACNYFLWGYLKAKVNTTRPRTINELMIVIWEKFSAIPENMARRTLGKLRARLEEFARNYWKKFSDVSFKTGYRET
jgi:hypothetical protein